jgi:predicted nucleic acid-binding protein
MRTIFVDTSFWVTKINPLDQLHHAALEVEAMIAPVQLVTTEAVLIETLNYFSEYRPRMKQTASTVVRAFGLVMISKWSGKPSLPSLPDKTSMRSGSTRDTA